MHSSTKQYTPAQPIILALLAGLGVACMPSSSYQCADDDQCFDGVLGTCEASGYCSFSDSSCPSQRRYSDYADDFSGQCVSEGVAKCEPWGEVSEFQSAFGNQRSHWLGAISANGSRLYTNPASRDDEEDLWYVDLDQASTLLIQETPFAALETSEDEKIRYVFPSEEQVVLSTRSGKSGDYDLRLASDSTGVWSSVLMSSLNTSEDEHCFWLRDDLSAGFLCRDKQIFEFAQDANTLEYTVTRHADELANHDIVTAAFSDNSLEIYFAEKNDLYYAQRASRDLPFEAPVHLHHMDNDWGAPFVVLSGDGQQVFFNHVSRKDADVTIRRVDRRCD